VELSGYACFTSVNGRYRLISQVQNLDGEVVWQDEKQLEVEQHDPLKTSRVLLDRRKVHVPKAGKYDFVMLANGDEVVRDAFWIHLPNQTSPELQALSRIERR
jgi:hypothetical protein